jgi:hypothetical protein
VDVVPLLPPVLVRQRRYGSGHVPEVRLYTLYLLVQVVQPLYRNFWIPEFDSRCLNKLPTTIWHTLVLILGCFTLMLLSVSSIILYVFFPRPNKKATFDF